MASLNFTLEDIPDLSGKRVIITGASSGIGRAAANIFARKGAWVLNLDVNPPSDSDPSKELLQQHGSGTVEYRHCDITNWQDLASAFQYAGNIDIAVSNAGIGEVESFLSPLAIDPETSLPVEPSSYASILSTNLQAAINFSRLAISNLTTHHSGSSPTADDVPRREREGSIVLTASATAYWPQPTIPVYSASKAGLIGFVRALRSILPGNITINAVAPMGTITALFPASFAAPLMEKGIVINSAEFVGLAVVYSAVAKEDEPLEADWKDYFGVGCSTAKPGGRWNGRTILTAGDRYLELEGPLMKLKPHWIGQTLDDTGALGKL